MDARKIALQFTVAGLQSIEVFDMLVFERAEDKCKYEVVIEKFDSHCSPKNNETFERFVFCTRLQQHRKTLVMRNKVYHIMFVVIPDGLLCGDTRHVKIYICRKEYTS